MNKKTVISATNNTMRKLKAFAGKKVGVKTKMVVTVKKLGLKARKGAIKAEKGNDIYKNKKTITSATDNTILKLRVSAGKKERARSKLVVTAKQLALLAKEKEAVRNKLVTTAKKLAITAKEAESVRRKLAVTAKEKEAVRSKLVVTAKKLAITAKEAESVRRKLAVTAKEKEAVRSKLVVTAKKLAVIAKEVGSANKYARSLIEASLDPLVTISPEGKITDVNKATIKVTGVSREKLISTDFSNYFTEPKKALVGYKQVFREGSVTDYPLTIMSQNGQPTDVLYNASVYKDDRGNVLGIFAAARNVTDAKKAKELLAVTAEKLAITAGEKEDVRTKLAVVAKKLAATAKEKENVRQKLVVIARQLKDKATQLAVTAKEKEAVRSKLVVTAKKLAVTAKEAESVRRKLAVTAKELAITARETELINKELRSLDAAKDEFVSIASHQLRTPLTALKGYTGMILDGDVGPMNDKQREYLVEIKNANDRMIALITALLNVSRVDLDVFIVEPEKLSLKKVAEDALKDLSIKIEEKQLQIETHFSNDVPLINADLNIVRMIFQNLLSNAVKYIPAKGKISINIKKDGSNVLISVADTGYGIPSDVQPKIFTKMFRADNARVKDPDGNGLGLYIIKSTLEKTGGKIWFESVENKGSTFYVTIPLEGMKKKEGTKRLEVK